MSMSAILPSNFILLADSYKLHHFTEYPSDTKFIYSTVVPRKASKYTSKIVAMGATFVANFLASVRITPDMIDEAEVEVNEYGYEFNRKDWVVIVNEYGGRLPLDVFGVEEGTVVKPNTPILGIVNSDERFPWLVSYVETVVQRIMWKMTTVATISRYCYDRIEAFMQESGADMSMLEYKLHNFGDRGADGEDGAIMAAIAHAALFSGSDCLSANRYIKRMYSTIKPYLSSVDATEHSVMCSHSDAEAKDDWGAAVMSVNRLYEAVARTKRGIGIPLQSVVIDTYDDVRFVDEYLGTRLKDRIINSGGVLVARPDSGDPLTKPIEIIRLLDQKFGSTTNQKGFKVLHPSVRVIQGDGINQDSIPYIMDNLLSAGYSMDNLTFGMGGGLTHGPGRDEFSFSMKATARYGDDGWVDLLKEPKTDSGKKSLKGLVHTTYRNGELETVVGNNFSCFSADEEGWRLYFCEGEVVYSPSFGEVRSRARA
jgi:nicotinamide phosphoribosyltransferase